MIFGPDGLLSRSEGDVRPLLWPPEEPPSLGSWQKESESLPQTSTEVTWEVVGEIRYFVKLPLESPFSALTVQRSNRLQDNIIRSDDEGPSYVRVSTRQSYIKLMRENTWCNCDEAARLEEFGSKGSRDRDTSSLREPAQNYLRGVDAVRGRNLIVDE